MLEWEEIQNKGEVYSPRTGFAAVQDGGAFYLFGGTDGTARQSDVYRFEVATYTWTKAVTTGTPPSGRSGAQAVVLDGQLWLYGGYTRKEGEYFNDVHRLNTNTQPMRWTQVQALGEAPQKRTDHSLVQFGRSMYVFAGFDGRSRYNDLVELSLDEPPRWSVVNTRQGRNEEPRSRFAHVAVVHQNSMVIFGGWDGHDTLSEVYEYSFPSQRWYPVDPGGQSPSPRYRHSAVVGGGSMFTFGGVDKLQVRFQDLFELDLVQRRWSEVLTLHTPSSRTFHKTVVHDGYLYILGGFDGRRQNDTHRIKVYDASRAQEPKPLDGTLAEEVFSPEDMWRWQQLRSEGEVYSPRTGHAVVVWGNYFFVFGGTDETARQNDIYMYEATVGRWSIFNDVSGNMPSARSGAKAVVHRDMIFVLGGYTKKDGEYFNDLYRLDIPLRRWTLVPGGAQAPSPRTDHTWLGHGQHLYVFGGFDGKSRFSDLHRFGVDNQQWELLPGRDGQAGPLGRFGHTAVVFSQSMYIFGGWNGHDTMDDLYEFSTTTLTWYSVPGRGNVPSSRYRHSAVVYGCCMFLFGGVDRRQDRFHDLHEFNFESRTWNQVECTGEVPSARTFHQALIYSGCMYLLGGFDGVRRNDMYRIPLPEELPQDEVRRRNREKLRTGGQDEERQPEEGDDDGENDLATEEGRLRQQIRELKVRLQKERERHICKICFDREIDAVVLPCNHRVFCYRCGTQARKCPLKTCDRPAQQVIQTFDG